MVDKLVVTPVGDVPTKWCHPTIFAPKPNNGIRVRTDLTKLNSQVDRTVHHINTPGEAVAEFDAEDKFFAKVDPVKGYWQMPLDEECSWYTVFLTPFGKFRYLRSPMGFVSTGDLLQWLTNHAVLIVGYGRTASGDLYWSVKNSWGPSWGENGYFKIRRGTDECGIESLAMESTPIITY